MPAVPCDDDALITNPLDSDLFLPTIFRLGGLLGGALVVLLVLSRGNPRRLMNNVLFQRWKTWAIIAPIYLLAVLSGEFPTTLMVTLLIALGLREYASLVGLPTNYRWVLMAMGIVAAPMAMLSIDGFHLLPPPCC